MTHVSKEFVKSFLSDKKIDESLIRCFFKGLDYKDTLDLCYHFIYEENIFFLNMMLRYNKLDLKNSSFVHHALASNKMEVLEFIKKKSGKFIPFYYPRFLVDLKRYDLSTFVFVMEKFSHHFNRKELIQITKKLTSNGQLKHLSHLIQRGFVSGKDIDLAKVFI